ncbi:MAG: hypothetical protein QNJ70_00370 [Xenococcaceae cyanobacterium MO_207.B15]|nr:hypothetical protein [Xenococcaceae cyanobacterium MO_207.B15]MDJ0746778.1 hypothetical protein [Xenococcaceae cyanobacterium MO_167.B27]
MDFKLVNSFTSELANLKVKDVYSSLEGDDETDIPFSVWLLENPTSPLPMPGKITLYNHDIIHILLGRDISPQDEAFVLGFTMGNDPSTNWFHLLIYKLFSRFIYPSVYKFNQDDMKVFDLGFTYGRQLSIKEIHKIEFNQYQDYTLSSLRSLFGIKFEDIKKLRQMERALVPHSQTSQSLISDFETAPKYIVA